MADRSLIDSFNFLRFGQGSKVEFKGYVSSIDPTTAGAGVLIGGSQNVYKSIRGTIRVRDGLKVRGATDATAAGVVSSFEWETSLGLTRVLRAADGKLQVEFDAGSGYEWYDLLTGLSDSQMAFSFTPWWDDDAKIDRLIFVNGEQAVNMWGGGITTILSASNASGIIIQTLNPNNITSAGTGQYDSGGVDYVVGDILTVTGGNGDALMEVDAVVAGGVKTASVASGGSGYAVDDLVKVGAGTTQALLKVTAESGGVVTGVSVVAAGVGNATGVGLATTNAFSAGTGLTVTISAVGNTISAWHLKNNGSGYSASTGFAAGSPASMSGGTGTGASLWIEQVASGRITIGGTESLSQLGFAGDLTPTDGTSPFRGGSIVVGGVTYTYAALGDDGFSFMDVTPDPSGITPGAVAVGTVITSTTTTSGNSFASVFGQNFTNDWVQTIGNQLYIGCYTSRQVFESKDTDYLNYAVPALRSPGDPNVYILDTNSRGALSKSGQKGNAVLFGSQGDSYSIVNTVETVQVSSTDFAYVENQTIDKQTSSDLSSPLSNDFIAAIGDTILFVDESHQLRQFGTLRNLNTPVYPILSLDIYTELAHTDLTGGALRAVAELSGETIYITVPISGALYIYQIRNRVDEVGNLRAERIWQPPFIVGASRIAVIDGVTYVHSNQNPMIYQLWDTGQYSDDSSTGEQLPYESHATFAYISLEDRTSYLIFDKLYFEGYMTRGTTLYCNVYEEYRGAKNLLTVTVNKPIDPGKKLARFYDATPTPSLGDVSLGEVPLGEGVLQRGGASIPKFRALRSVTGADMFEFALDLASYDLDCEWELLMVGVNAQESTRQTAVLFKTT